MKKIILPILIIIIIVGLVLYWNFQKSSEEEIRITNFEECVEAGYPVLESYPRQCSLSDNTTFYEDINSGGAKSNLIKVTVPSSNQIVKSPLEIRGEARGYWFFEASFPIKLVDGNGKELGVAIATALSDWMVEDFVPFEAVLEFENPTTTKGTLVLIKDNPSGLPEHDDQLEIPISFELGSTTIKVFFGNSELDPQALDCQNVFEIEREVAKTQGISRVALEELFKGPTENEENEGFFTSINAGVKIQSLSIKDGVAKVDFDEQLEYQVGGSCRVAAIRAQITETLKQFPTVDSVIISIDGRTEDILQP